MIVKTVEQLKMYLADGGDPERISIMMDPVPVKPNPVIYSGEGRHITSTYAHGYVHCYIRKDSIYEYTGSLRRIAGSVQSIQDERT